MTGLSTRAELPSDEHLSEPILAVLNDDSGVLTPASQGQRRTIDRQFVWGTTKGRTYKFRGTRHRRHDTLSTTENDKDGCVERLS